LCVENSSYALLDDGSLPAHVRNAIGVAVRDGHYDTALEILDDLEAERIDP